MVTESERAIADAVDAIMEVLRGDSDSGFLQSMLRAIALRGGLVDGLIRRDIVLSVADEVIDRVMAQLSAQMTPGIDRISPEVGLAVDEELARIRIEAVAMLAAAFPYSDDDSLSP